MPPPCRGSRRRMVNKAIIAFHVFMSNFYVAGQRRCRARVQSQPIDLMRLQSWETVVRLRRPEVGFRPRKANENIALRGRPATTKAPRARKRFDGRAAALLAVASRTLGGAAGEFPSYRSPCAPTGGDGPSSTLSPAKIAAAPEPTPARPACRRQHAATADDGRLTHRVHAVERNVRRSQRRHQTREIESRKNRRLAAIKIHCAIMPSTTLRRPRPSEETGGPRQRAFQSPLPDGGRRPEPP
jgi:hypothetical protein